MNVQYISRRGTVRVDGLNQELGAQYSGQDTKFLGKTNQKGQTGEYGNYWLKRTFLPAVPPYSYQSCTQSVFRSDRSGTRVYYQSRRKRWPHRPTTTILPSLNMTTSLDQLKQTGTVVVSDSGDFECGFSCFSEFFNHLNFRETAIDVYKPQASSKGLAVSHHRAYVATGCDNESVAATCRGEQTRLLPLDRCRNCIWQAKGWQCPSTSRSRC